MSACAIFALLFVQGSTPQSWPDLSGRWTLTAPAESGGPTILPPGMTAANELMVVQDATSIAIEPGTTLSTHPKAATHRFGSHGTVGGTGERSSSHVFWFGDQLIISTTSTGPPDAEGRQRTSDYGERWSLNANGQLVIYFSERDSDGVSYRGTLVYERTKALESAQVTGRRGPRSQPRSRWV